MTDLGTGLVGRQIEAIFEGSSVAGLTDRQLIDRFTTRRDAGAEAAFAALVARHGPLVLGVCRQVLSDRHHAEDAFQAVFLVLACKARSIRDPDLVGTWLYGVTLRTARKAKLRLGRLHKNAESDYTGCRDAVATAPPADESAMACERATVLHDEIARLPGSFRLPVVLCYFEGLTLDEAAHRLQCPVGTLRSRLARAKDKLRRRLTRRGVVLPAAGLTVGLGSRSVLASHSATRCDTTARAAIQFAARQTAGATLSSPALELAREVLDTMLWHKLKAATLSLVLIATLTAGAGYYSLNALARSRENEHPGEPRREPARTEPRPPEHIQSPPAPGRMFVVGRVLDPQGKPVPNAATMVYAAIKQPGSGGGGLVEKMKPSPIGQARSDDSGWFQVDVPRTSSARHHQMGAVAVAAGYGAGWVEFDPDADRPIAEISLRPEQVIQGRLFDLVGRPVPGVEVRVESMGRVVPGNPRNRDRESIDGLIFWKNPGNGLPAWPSSAMSDSEGRFTCYGVGRDLWVVLMIDDPRFARQTVPINTDGIPNLKPVTLALEPAKIISGRITDADTGKPIPYSQVTVLSYDNKPRGKVNEFEADAQGRFRANPMSADRYEVSVTAAEGQLFLGVSKVFNWPKGAVEYPIDLALPRGLAIRGKVTEEGSGKPVAGARISFRTRRPAEGRAGAFTGRAASGSDGSFQIGVVPGPGDLVVLGPTDDYVLREIDEGMVPRETPGGRRRYAHAFIACDVKPKSEGLEVNVLLRPAITVSGRVIGPDDQPIQNAWMISRICLFPSHSAWLTWRAQYHDSVTNGRFEVHGLDADAEVSVYFLDPHHKLGATADFPDKSAAGGSVTVRLQHCGTANARVVDASGKPIAGYRGSHLISMVVTLASLSRYQEGTMSVIDPINYAEGPVSDALGRIAFPALIPGARYHLSISAKTGTPRDMHFTVKAGEMLDLGDVVIQKPQAR